MGKKFTEDYQPGKRGPSKKTLILDAIKEQSLIDSNPNMSNAEVEKLFFAHTAKRAFNPSDESNTMLLKLLFDKGWASVKPELEKVNFEFDSSKPATQQANDILKAVSGGDISPDAAKAVMDIVKMAIDIEVNTELKQRIEEIEKALGINA